MNPHFGFIRFPDELTTGSSIMPHKKNPDVFELIRAKTNQIQSSPNAIMLQLVNLTTGYHRDLQVLKETTFPDLEKIKSCLEMTQLMLENIEVKKDILKDPFYTYLFSVEEVNRMVLAGQPFRDAYKEVGRNIEKGDFNPKTDIEHHHEGSIGNLCLEEIRTKMHNKIREFDFKKTENQLNLLIKS